MPKTVAALLSKFKYKEIQQIFKKARYSYSSQALDIKLSPATANFGKLLIIIPKKVGNAPERNLIKRRLKSIFYENQIYNYLYNFLIYCKPSILQLNYKELKEIMLNSIS